MQGYGIVDSLRDFEQQIEKIERVEDRCLYVSQKRCATKYIRVPERDYALFKQAEAEGEYRKKIMGNIVVDRAQDLISPRRQQAILQKNKDK